MVFDQVLLPGAGAEGGQVQQWLVTGVTLGAIRAFFLQGGMQAGLEPGFLFQIALLPLPAYVLGKRALFVGDGWLSAIKGGDFQIAVNGLGIIDFRAGPEGLCRVGLLPCLIVEPAEIEADSFRTEVAGGAGDETAVHIQESPAAQFFCVGQRQMAALAKGLAFSDFFIQAFVKSRQFFIEIVADDCVILVLLDLFQRFFPVLHGRMDGV